MELPLRFMQLIVLLHSCAGSEELVTIPWTSAQLAYKRSFSVHYGNTIFFYPCGDSSGTNLVFTDTKALYQLCLSHLSILPNATYVEVGNSCFGPLGSLTLTVSHDLVQGLDVFYILSDYQNECNDGLKAEITVLYPSIATSSLDSATSDINQARSGYRTVVTASSFQSSFSLTLITPTVISRRSYGSSMIASFDLTLASQSYGNISTSTVQPGSAITYIVTIPVVSAVAITVTVSILVTAYVAIKGCRRKKQTAKVCEFQKEQSVSGQSVIDSSGPEKQFTTTTTL